ncbi:DUF3710 domain-containing protein [Arcanobacterium haemolyticum]|nr:DUF3710 domain-containing protein [Arcanobacterium haemolyticum]
MGLFSRKKKAVAEEAIPTQEETEQSAGIGPWDEADVDGIGSRLDAGALWLPIVKDAAIQFSVDQNRQVVLGAVYIKQQTAVQLQVFAAPKSSELWDDVRAEVIETIAKQGGSSRDNEGEYGTEIRAHMPVPGNARGVQPIRYLGIDGPRWLLRVTVTGCGAVDEEIYTSFVHEVLDDLVVVRGNTPHPPRELLELRVPQVAKTDESPSRPKIELPKRGPEIQDIR